MTEEYYVVVGPTIAKVVVREAVVCEFTLTEKCGTDEIKERSARTAKRFQRALRFWQFCTRVLYGRRG